MTTKTETKAEDQPMAPPKPETKISKARTLLNELRDEKLPEGVSLRKHFITTAMKELDISNGCAVTYYSNLQNEAKGRGLYHNSGRKAKTVAEVQGPGGEQEAGETPDEVPATESPAEVGGTETPDELPSK